MRVLVVEDNTEIREGLRRLLEGDGYDVTLVANGQEALEWLVRRRAVDHPCVILVDMMMPIMNGWEFIRHLQSDDILLTIPLVVSTGLDVKAGELGPETRVFKKPYDVGALLNEVHRHCRPAQANGDARPSIPSG